MHTIDADGGLVQSPQVVHKKTATALALTSVKNEDKHEFSKVVEAVKANFNDRFDEFRRSWGGGIMGVKSQAKVSMCLSGCHLKGSIFKSTAITRTLLSVALGVVGGSGDKKVAPISH